MNKKRLLRKHKYRKCRYRYKINEANYHFVLRCGALLSSILAIFSLLSLCPDIVNKGVRCAKESVLLFIPKCCKDELFAFLDHLGTLISSIKEVIGNCLLWIVKKISIIPFFHALCEFVSSFSEYFSSKYNPIFAALAGVALSGIILLLNGEKRNIYLQIIIFKRTSPLAVLTLAGSFVLSFCLSGIADVHNSHLEVTAAAMSMMLCIFVIVWYLIRYNNENMYFADEKCRVIFKCISKSKKRLYEYLEHLFPKNPSKQNNYEDDIALLELVLKNASINDKYRNIVSRDLNECANHNQADNDLAVTEYFYDIIIPIVVHMMRMYRGSKDKFILQMQNKLSLDFTSDSTINRYFRYLLIVVTTQHLVEVFADFENDIDFIEQKKDLLKWLSSNVKSFEKLYGKISSNIPDGNINSDILSDYLYHDDKYVTTDWQFVVYRHYIDLLAEVDMIQINSFIRLEIDFLEKHEVIPIEINDNLIEKDYNYNYQYNSMNIVYLMSRLYNKV